MKNRMKKLPIEFYRRDNVIAVAKELLGKILVTKFNGIETSGRIVEVEAYNGEIDKASHAYGGRRTNRTEKMYAHGGVCYVYLCYGIHHLFNAVSNDKDIPHAILIRALEPIKGIEKLREAYGLYRIYSPAGNHKPLPKELKEVISKYREKYY